MPYAGGLLDQPAGLLDEMAVAYSTLVKVEEFDKLPAGAGSAWIRENADVWPFIAEVLDG